MRLGMMIELDKCVGCKACVTSCKERWDSGPGAARNWVQEYESGRRGADLAVSFYPGLCMQCEEHPCTNDCPTGATYADERGVVVVDPRVCIGCGNCIPRCPYGARAADPVKGIVEKCNLCEPYLLRGEKAACVATCLAECRHVGDLSDPQSEVSILAQARKAAPLKTAAIDVGPRNLYAPSDKRELILQKSPLQPLRSTPFTALWQKLSRPLARIGTPAVVLLAIAGGVLVNLRSRKAAVAASEHKSAKAPALARHPLGLRLLHWFNAVSWLLLLVTGTALISAPSFALFGEGLPQAIIKLFGSTANLIRGHVLWGLLWAVVIVPVFLYYKNGGLEALREILLTRDDLRWLRDKPLVALGLRKGPLPPQDKYNAGQKVFAISALVGTTVIIASGVVMTFHLGPPAFIREAILLHKLAIALGLMGLAVHITMAALVTDERPALRSMLRGDIDREHAETHSAKWVEEVDKKDGEEKPS